MVVDAKKVAEDLNRDSRVGGGRRVFDARTMVLNHVFDFERLLKSDASVDALVEFELRFVKKMVDMNGFDWVKIRW